MRGSEKPQGAFLVAECTCCSLRAPTQVLSPEQLPEDTVLGRGKVCGCSLEWSGWSTVLEQSCCKPADQGVNHCKALLCSLGLPTLAVMAGLGAQVSQAGAAAVSSKLFQLDKPCCGISALSFSSMGSCLGPGDPLSSSALFHREQTPLGPEGSHLPQPLLTQKMLQPLNFLALSAPVTPHLFCVAVCAAVSGHCFSEILRSPWASRHLWEFLGGLCC